MKRQLDKIFEKELGEGAYEALCECCDECDERIGLNPGEYKAVEEFLGGNENWGLVHLQCQNLGDWNVLYVNSRRQLAIIDLDLVDWDEEVIANGDGI